MSLSCLSRQLEVFTSTRDLMANPAAPVAVGKRAANRPPGQTTIPKSGNRFSDKIMVK
jgi:hypothetical protein